MTQFLAAELVAGTTWAWFVCLADYDPAVYTLSIFLRGQGIKVDAVAVPDPDNPRQFSFSVAAADSDVTPGLASFQVRITDGTTVTELARGTVTILANLEKMGDDFDARSFAAQMVDKIEALLQDKNTRLPIEYMIQGRQFRFQSHKELIEARGYWKAEVTRERIQSGELPANYNQVLVAFGRSGGGCG